MGASTQSQAQLVAQSSTNAESQSKLQSPPAGERTAIVTGAARGIGAAIAERLVADGLRVASLDVLQPEAPRTGIVDLCCDLTDSAQVASVVDRVRTELGPALILVHLRRLPDDRTHQ